MYKLQYFNGTKWETIGEYLNPYIAWITLGSDTYNYRIVDKDGIVIKEDSELT